MSEHTPGPWVQFSDQGKCVAIMPAGRDGDICTFEQSPSDADARLIAAAPSLVRALEQAKAAMLRTRTASIAGCEEGYGKPEKWADELFASHGDLTASIKAIDGLLGVVGGSPPK